MSSSPHPGLPGRRGTRDIPGQAVWICNCVQLRWRQAPHFLSWNPNKRTHRKGIPARTGNREMPQGWRQARQQAFGGTRPHS